VGKERVMKNFRSAFLIISFLVLASCGGGGGGSSSSSVGSSGSSSGSGSGTGTGTGSGGSTGTSSDINPADYVLPTKVEAIKVE
jgi:hypothetical protein